MKTVQFVVVALVLMTINANMVSLDAAHAEVAGAELVSPQPCHGDNGSQGSNGQGSCINGDYAESIRRVSYESAIEQIGSTVPIMSFSALSQHVIAHSQQALGYSAVLSDETLASLAWIFRLRHMPDPVITTYQTTRYDVARAVRYILTNANVTAQHHWTECKINELIQAVNASIEQPTGFVFRMVDGDASEYGQLGLHSLVSRLHVFAAVHTQDKLYLSVVSGSLKGEFIKGHGGQNAIAEREEAFTFLKQWLLNQWVNIWTCTNPGSN